MAGRNRCYTIVNYRRKHLTCKKFHLPTRAHNKFRMRPHPNRGDNPTGMDEKQKEFYLSVPLTDKIRQKLGQASWKTGMKWDEIAAALLHSAVLQKGKLKFVAFGITRAAPVAAGASEEEADVRTTRRLQVPVSKSLLKRLQKLAKVRTEESVARDILHYSLVDCLKPVEAALNRLYQSRKDTAQKARSQIAQRLAHREQALALEGKTTLIK